MTALRRRAFNFSAFLSLLVCAAVLAAWALSHSRIAIVNHWTYRGDQCWNIDGYLSKGAIMLRHHHGVRNESFCKPHTLRDWRLMASPWNLYESLEPVDRVIFDGVSDEWRRDLLCLHFKGYRKGYGHGGIHIDSQTHLLVFPLWALASTFLVLPAAWLLRTRPPLRHRRLKAGLCTHCGYDLRASPERCPECGTAT